MEQYTKFCANTRKPAMAPPSGSCDCQVHTFADTAKHPPRAGTAYAPPGDATVQAALRMHRTLGIDRGVIVQSTAHGTNYSIFYDALAAAGPNYRGVAVIDDSVSDDEIMRLHQAGVRAARFNFWKRLNIRPTPELFLRTIERIKPYGWHAKLHCAAEDWLELGELFSGVNSIPVVMDHMGHKEMHKGWGDPALKVLLNLLSKDNWWIMISNADRISAQQDGWSDALPLARKLIATAPDRSIWSTDWPHVQYRKPMPNDAQLLEFLYDAAPDPEQLRRILVDNPARLFGF